MKGAPTPTLDSLIEVALAEDLAAGDLTTDVTQVGDVHSVGEIVAGQEMIVAGTKVLERVFNRVDPYVSVSIHVPDGTKAITGEVIAGVSGSAGSILAAERVALNFLMHLSGVASLTREYVDRLPEGTKARVCDTRKTIPGLRSLQKYAVRCGGGTNHRPDLSGGVLVKDNHIAALGSLAKAVANARTHLNPSHRVEVEVQTLEQVDEAIAAGAEVVLLDNMPDDTIAMAVQRIAGRALVEVSGNVTPDRVARLARAGVDFVSVGALTHSAPACDVSLDLRIDRDSLPG